MRQNIIALVVILWGQVCFAEEEKTGTTTETFTVIVESMTDTVGHSPYCSKVELSLVPFTNQICTHAVLLLDEFKQILLKIDKEMQKIEDRIEEIEVLKQRYDEMIIEMRKQEEMCIRGKCEHWKRWREQEEDLKRLKEEK